MHIINHCTPFFTLYSEAILSEHSLSLLVPAAKYEIPLLVQNCTQKLIHNLSVETVPQILQAAVIADNQLLRKSCIAFVASHLSEVVVTEGKLQSYTCNKMQNMDWLLVHIHAYNLYDACFNYTLLM